MYRGISTYIHIYIHQTTTQMTCSITCVPSNSFGICRFQKFVSETSFKQFAF